MELFYVAPEGEIETSKFLLRFLLFFAKNYLVNQVILLSEWLWELDNVGSTTTIIFCMANLWSRKVGASPKWKSWDPNPNFLSQNLCFSHNFILNHHGIWPSIPITVPSPRILVVSILVLNTEILVLSTSSLNYHLWTLLSLSFPLRTVRLIKL